MSELQEETRGQFITRWAHMLVDRMTPEQAEIIRQRIHLRLVDGLPRINEQAFVDLCADLCIGAMELLPSLKPKPGFSSTICNLNDDEFCALSQNLASAMGAKLLLTLVNQLHHVSEN